jgi:hypothetical protein
MDIRKPSGEVVYRAQFESYVGGDTTYSATAEWYPDGRIKKMGLGFSRNISSLVGQALNALTELAGAAGNKL